MIFEITADSYTKRVFSGEKILSERTMQLESPGRARAIKKGDIFDDIPDFESLAEAIDDGSCFSILSRLNDIRGEYE